MAYVSLEQRLAAIETGLSVSVAVPEAGALLAPFGFDQTKIGEGQQLLADARDLANQQKVEYGEQYEATQAVQEAWEAAKAAYSPTLALARIALKNDTAAQTALGLTGSRKQSLSGWIDQATTFYANLLANPGWVAALATFNRDQAALTAEQSLIQALVDANVNQEKEKGESREATRARDAKLEELFEWYGDYRDIAVIALDGHPEWIALIRKGEVE